MDGKNKIIPLGKHALICGMTGTGKSFLAEQYVKGYPYAVKLDTKDETAERKVQGLSAWEGLKEGTDFQVVRDFEELEYAETPKIIFCPDFLEQTQELFDDFFQWIFLRQNTCLWIDELMSVGTVHKYPPQLGRLYTQGRSKFISLFSCTQRPSGIPTIALSNSSYFFVFDMMNLDDRKKMASCTGMEKMKESPDGHNFWFYEIGKKETQKCVLVP